MRLGHARVHSLARALTQRLIDGNFIRYQGAIDSLIEIVETIIEDEIQVEQRLEADVEKLLESYHREIDRGQVDYHQMFMMVKKKLAKERGIVL